MWLFLASVALGQTAEEITVYGDPEVEQALDEVLGQLRGLGYDRKIVDKGDRFVLKHDRVWRGKVVVHRDGIVEHKRQGVLVKTPEIPNTPRATGALLCVVQPTACVRVGGLVVSKKKLAHEKRRTMNTVAPTVANLQDRIADAHTQQRVEALPDQLQALWDDGTQLFGDQRIDGWADKRAHLLDYWDSRTNNAWGERVRESVEAFLRGVVQRSEHPFTDAELASFEAERRATRPLVLTRTVD